MGPPDLQLPSLVDLSWTEKGAHPKEARVEPAAAPGPKLPADLERCLRRGVNQASKQPHKKNPKPESAKVDGDKAPQVVQPNSPSADQLVTARLQTEKEREVCARAILAWSRKK
jgi:hypothetical protein